MAHTREYYREFDDFLCRLILYSDVFYIHIQNSKVRSKLKLAFDTFSYLLLMASTYLYVMSKCEKLIKKKNHLLDI